MNVSFVLEGDASRAREVPSAAPPSRDEAGGGGAAAPPTGEGNDRAELEGLARRFDYSVESVRGLDGVYVLKKQYSRPDDLPEVTFEECAASLGDVNKLTAPFDIGISSAPALSPRVQEVLASFTEEQLAVMRRRDGRLRRGVAFPPPPGGALPVSSLTKEQREVVTGIAVATYAADALRVASDLAREAGWLVKNGVSLRWAELRGGLFLGYESPYAPKPLGVRPLGPLPPPGNRDQAVAPLQSPFVPPSSGQAMPLRELARGATEGSPSPPKMVVDPAVAGKRITVVSGAPGEPLTDAQLASAAASVYGLRLVALADGGLRLTRRRLTPAPDIAGLRERILEALPAPVARALLQAERTAQPAQPAQPPRTDEGRSAPPPAVPPVARRMESVRSAAIGSLRRETAAKLPHTSLAPLPLSECSEEAGRAFAVAYLLNALKSMEEIVARPTPRTLARISELHISGGMSKNDGISMFVMVFSVPREGGNGFSSDKAVIMPHPLSRKLLPQSKPGSATQP